MKPHQLPKGLGVSALLSKQGFEACQFGRSLLVHDSPIVLSLQGLPAFTVTLAYLTLEIKVLCIKERTMLMLCQTRRCPFAGIPAH